MNENTAEVIDLAEERHKRIQPKLAGSEPPEGPFWLENIPIGWGFICRLDPKRTGNRTFMASVLQKVTTLGPCTRLWNTEEGGYFWVVTRDFSNTNEWLQSIPVIPSEKEESDGTDNRTDSTELVENS